ncbi:MAG: hypothetical protein ACRDN9_16075 [Streptosporangiaceae bacterium]
MRRLTHSASYCRALAVIGCVLAAGCSLVRPGMDTQQVAATPHLHLERTVDGLLIADDFAKPVSARDLQDTYEFNGDADPSRAYVRAPGHGLRVGVRRHRGSTFRGWFAVTLAAFPASGVYHVHMARPRGNVTGAGREAETVFAVQTASTKVTGLINFIEVSSDSDSGTTAWQVDYAHGHIANSNNRLYWRSPQSSHAATSKDITIRTDGHHQLTVWFGDRVVFRSNDLKMRIQPPFQPYLEVQAQRVAYVSTFTDFWATKSSAITLTGLRAGTHVALRTPDGVTIATARASSSGVATVRLPPPRARGRASVVLTSPGGSPVVRGPFDYAGGDRYRVTRP